MKAHTSAHPMRCKLLIAVNFARSLCICQLLPSIADLTSIMRLEVLCSSYVVVDGPINIPNQQPHRLHSSNPKFMYLVSSLSQMEIDHAKSQCLCWQWFFKNRGVLIYHFGRRLQIWLIVSLLHPPERP